MYFQSNINSFVRAVDVEFEQSKEQILKLDANMNQIYKDIQKLDEHIKMMAEPFLSISTLLGQFYNMDETKTANGEKFRNASMVC